MMTKDRLMLNLVFSITTHIFAIDPYYVNYSTHQYKALHNKYVAMVKLLSEVQFQLGTGPMNEKFSVFVVCPQIYILSFQLFVFFLLS
jgi:hypothetical protein